MRSCSRATHDEVYEEPVRCACARCRSATPYKLLPPFPQQNAIPKADARVLKLVQQMAQQGKYVTAICAAPSVLATAGLLDGKQATCFPGALDAFPQVAQRPAAIVEDGKLITSRDPGTAMDFALTLVERLTGKEKRLAVEAGLQR